MFKSSALKNVLVFICFSQILCEDKPQRQPLYKYRYETEDMMKTSASSAPVRGYHVVEGGYYPAESGLVGAAIGPITAGGLGIGGGQFIGGGAGLGHLGYGGIGGGAGIGGGGIGYGIEEVGPIGGGGIGYGHIAGPHFIGSLGGIGPGIGAAGIGAGGIGVGGIGAGGIGAGGIGIGGGLGGGIHGHGYGGEAIDKSQFSEGKKNLADAKFEKAHGKKGEEVNHGQEGFSQGSQGVKEINGEEGHYSNAAGGKNVIQDGKQYYGGQNYNQEGKNGEELQNKKGHKKGHKIKGFKTSHHKDESGKTEEYYDEEHDEGDNFAFKGQNGAYGQQSSSSFKGGHVDDKFNEAAQKKSGHHSNEFAVQKQNADQGKYGENKYAGGGSTYGVNNGFDQQSLLGHQENSRLFKHHQVPFYHHY